jgi:dipeptidyl aminopeptidase/acylaminoacyl peptidase
MFRQGKALAASVVLAIANAVGSSAALAQKTAADISVEDFFKVAEFQSMLLSPNGKLLAASTPFKGRQNLVVVDLAARKNNVITAYEKQDAILPRWISDNRLCFSAADGLEASGRPRFRGTYCIDADGKNLRDFTKTGLSILSTLTGEPGVVIASQRGRSDTSQDVFKVNTYTGKSELVTFESPGRVSQWILDRNNVPRVAVRQEESVADGATLWMRSSADGKYEKIGQYKADEPSIDPIGFDWDGTLYVISNFGRDKAALFKWDWANKKVGELVAEDAKVDLGQDARFGLIPSASKKKIVGYTYNSTNGPVTKWFDDDLASAQKMLDASLKGTFNTMSFPRDNEKLVLVESVSETEPLRYSLFNREAKTLEPIVGTRPWLKGELMPTRKYIEYKARDGRTIPAYLTLPRNVEAKALPLIINIHGGPQVRGYHMLSNWGRWPEAMFFASRGYAVLEPDPRKSTGYGRDHYLSGFRQWGLAMQDDITDGALHLVKEGIVNKDKMGLHGGSYGGYASLQGLVKDPEMFKAANSFLSVTDLPTFFSYAGSDISSDSDYLETTARKRVGDPKADAAQFEATSPARNAHKIKARVLLTMGSEDIRVPLKHGDLMVSAMEKAKVNFEYHVYKEESHGYNKPVNVNDFYSRALKLFDETIGPKSK